jgi:hypothetical protein
MRTPGCTGRLCRYAARLRGLKARSKQPTHGWRGAAFPLVRQAAEKDIMLKDFNVSEKGHGSYWPLGILRRVMVLIFISFGIQKFTPQSADDIALYISNSPFVSWLSIFGIRGEFRPSDY